MRVFRAQLGLICIWQIQVWPCLSVKDINYQCDFPQSPPWAMWVSTILTLDRMDFDAIFQQINFNLSRKLYALTFGLQGLVAWQRPRPRILRVFILPPANFRQSFVSRVLKNRDLSCYGEIFLPIYAGASRVPPRVLAIWPKTLRGQWKTQGAIQKQVH